MGQTKDGKLQCDYCGKIKQGAFTFFIGAAREPDWTMMEGTGKITCPDCYEGAARHAQHVINKALGIPS